MLISAINQIEIYNVLIIIHYETIWMEFNSFCTRFGCVLYINSYIIFWNSVWPKLYLFWLIPGTLCWGAHDIRLSSRNTRKHIIGNIYEPRKKAELGRHFAESLYGRNTVTQLTGHLVADTFTTTLSCSISGSGKAARSNNYSSQMSVGATSGTKWHFELSKA